VVGVESPIQWELLADEEDPSTYRYSLQVFTHVNHRLTRHERIFVPKSDLDLEVSRHGSDQPGTPVVIAPQTPETNQTWRLQRAETPEWLGRRQTLPIAECIS
jgi:hypothetical protein